MVWEHSSLLSLLQCCVPPAAALWASYSEYYDSAVLRIGSSWWSNSEGTSCEVGCLVFAAPLGFASGGYSSLATELFSIRQSIPSMPTHLKRASE